MPGHHCGRVIHQTSRQHRSFAMKRARGSDYLLLGGCWGIQMAGSWQLNSLKRNAGWLPLSGRCWQALSLNTVMTELRTERQGTEEFFLTDRGIYYLSFFFSISTHKYCTIIYILFYCHFISQKHNVYRENSVYSRDQTFFFFQHIYSYCSFVIKESYANIWGWCVFSANVFFFTQ